MLNELKTLSDSIRNIGISVENWDDKFKEVKTTSPCFVIALSIEGTIADIRKLDADKAKGLRTWLGGSLGSTFPAFNFQPFYAFVKGKGKGKGPSPKEKATAIADLVHRLIESTTLPDAGASLEKTDRSKADEKTSSCLVNVSDSFFTRVCAKAEEDDLLVRFRNAFRRFMPSGSSAETFNDKLLACLRRVPNLESNAAIDVLISGGDVVLFFDLVDTDVGVIASESTMRAINERLLATKGCSSKNRKKESKPAAPEIDAFGKGLSTETKGEKLPEVKLPGVLANTKLRSMNAESACQTRYGMIDAESFPVGAEIRTAAKGALEWISSQEREGATWAVAGPGELVFAYPKKIPSTPPKLARLLGNGRRVSTDGEKATADAEARFEEYATEALKGLKTLSQGPAPNTEIEVFAIKKADKARRKIVFYRNYSLERLESAVNDWNEGGRNLPPIVLRRWPVAPKGEKLPKGTKPAPLDFHAPLPIVAMSRVYTVCTQDGNEPQEPKFRLSPLYKIDKKDKKGKFPLSDGLELFLGETTATGLSERTLSLLLQGSGGLCIVAGNLAHKHEVLANAKAATHLETALPLLGILLHKLNHNKENYMENAPYLIGRFLNLADGLHAVWCRNVKDKDPLPPQLLGSSLFASFLLNPVQAFGNAGLRMKPYFDWAKTNQTSDAKLSRWFLGEFGRVTAAIKEAGIPPRLTDADKAEMLLGYLASTGKQDESEPSQPEPSK